MKTAEVLPAEVAELSIEATLIVVVNEAVSWSTLIVYPAVMGDGSVEEAACAPLVMGGNIGSVVVKVVVAVVSSRNKMKGESKRRQFQLVNQVCSA